MVLPLRWMLAVPTDAGSTKEEERMTRRETVFLGTFVVLFLISIRLLLGPLATGAQAPLEVSFGEVDQALRAGDISRAERAWRLARAEVGRRHGWPALAALGDAAVRMGDIAGDRTRYAPHAREAYVAALVRARAERSVPGVTRMCHAFIALGDADVAQQCQIIAATLQPKTLEAPMAKRP